ncbi:MAG: hypothetical protein HY020_10320, partial [Burkholderiales bacterium]|nr:hypothetical protein [Burkholderiales bacterium]
ASNPNDTGVGVGVAINVATNTNEARLLGDAIVAAQGANVRAGMTGGGTHTTGAEAKSGAGGAKTGIAGALAVNVAVDRTTAEVVAGASVNAGAGASTISAASKRADGASATPTDSGVQADAKNTGVGASVAVNVPDVIARGEIGDGATVSSSGALTVSGSVENAITTTAEGGAKGETAVAPVVAVTVANQDAIAHIGAGAATNAAGAVTVASSLKSTNTTKAEGKAEGSKDAAVGAAVAVNVELDHSRASVNRNLTGTTGVAITAASESDTTAQAKASAVGGKEDDSKSSSDDHGVDDQNAAARSSGDSAAAAGGARNSSSSTATPSAQSAGGGTVSVAAAVAVNIADATASATVSGASIASSGAVTVASTADSDAKASADGSTRAKDASNPNDTGVGVGVAVNVAHSTNEARVLTGSTINSQGLNITAGMASASGDGATHTTAAEARSGAGGAKTGVAGALAVNVAVDRTTAELAAGASANAGAGASSVTARSTHDDSAKAMPTDSGVQADAKDTGVGASVAVNVVDHIARAEVVNTAGLSSAGAMTIASALQNTLTTQAEGGAKGGTAVAPVVAVTVANQDSIARLGTGGLLTATGDLAVTADLRSTNNTTAKGKAEGSKDAAVGASVAVNVELDHANAELARSVTSTGAVSVAGTSQVSTTAKAEASAVGGEQDDSNSSSDDDGVNQKTAAGRGLGNSAAGAGGARNSSSSAATPSAGVASTDSTSGDSGSSETVSVAAAVGVNITDVTSRARISAGTISTPTKSVAVQSSANTDVQAIADGSATTSDGGTGVGAAVAVNYAAMTNEALVDSGVVITADGLQLGATMTNVGGDTTHTTLASAKSGAGGGDIGVAGSVAINIVNEDTRAQMSGNATLAGADSGGALQAITQSTASDTAKAIPENEGGQAGGSDVGVGASVAVNIVDRNLDATLADGAQIAGNVSAMAVTSTAMDTITTETENGAKGDTGVGVAAAVTVDTNNTHALAGTATGTLAVAGDMAVRAFRLDQVNGSAKADAAGKDTAVGASVVVTVVDGDVSARLARSVTAGGAADVSSCATVLATGSAKASASGNSSGGRSADSESSNQLNNNPNNGGDRTLPKSNDQTNSANSQTSGETGGSGSSGTGVAAAIVVQVLVTDNTASVADGVKLTAGGAMTVDAQADYNVINQAQGDAIDLSKDTNVGAAVALGVTDASNVASVGANADLRGASVLIRADRPGDSGDHEFRSLGVAAAGGKDTSVAGSVAINIVTLDTAASVGSGTQVRANAGKLDVVADQSTAIQAIAGAAALSTGGTGVGASVGLNIVVERTNATVGAGAQLAARDATTVTATGQVVPATMDLPDPLPNLTVSNLAISGGISTDGAAGAGSAAVNIYTLDTIARLDNGVTVNDAALGVAAGAAQDVTVASKSRTDIEGGAGAGGISISNAGVGIGLDVSVLIENTKTTLGSGVALKAGRDIAVRAGSDQDITSVAATAGVATDGTGVGGSVSVYIVTNDTEVTTAGGAGSALQAGGSVAVTADAPFDINQIAGALAYGNSAGVGISSTVLVHNDTVQALVGPSTVIAAGSTGGVDVAATSHENILTIAVGGGASSSAAVAGSVVVNVLNETTKARIDDSATFTVGTVSGATQANMKVRADDESSIISVAGSVAASSSVGVGLGVVVNTLNKTTEARLGSGVTGTVDGDLSVTSASNEDISTVAAGVAASSSVGVAADANVQVLNITTRAVLGDDPTDAKASAGAGDVHAQGSIVVAADENTEIDLITGSVGASGSAGVGAAVGVVTANKNTVALVGDGAKVTADGLRTGLTVEDGGIGVGFSASTPMNPNGLPNAAAGQKGNAAAFEVGTPTFNAASGSGQSSDDQSFTGNRVATPSTRSGFTGLAVTATNRDDIETFAVALGAGTAGIGVGSATNVVSTTTTAGIGAGANVNADTSTGGAGQSVLVGAGDDFSHVALAGALGFGTVGVAPGVDVTVLTHDTSASIGGNASVKARDDVVVQAANQDHLLLISAGIAAGTVGVGGAVNVLVLNNHTAATLGAASAVQAGGDVGVLARDGTDTTLIAGALGAGTVGVGASVGVMSITKHTDAGVLTGASVDAKGAGTGLLGMLDGSVGQGGMGKAERHGVVVQADSSEDFFHLDVAAGFGYVGVGGGVGVSLLDSDTTAIIGANTKINRSNGNAGADADQGVYVTAANRAGGTHFTGAVAGGFVGVGGAVQVGSLRNDTAARILGNADVAAAGDVAVNGLSRIDLNSLTISGAGGFVGAAGAVTVWSVGTPLERSYQNDQGSSADGLTKTQGDGSSGSGDSDAARQATLAKGQVGSVLGGFSGGSAGSGQQRVHDRAGGAGSFVNGSGPSQAEWLAAINASNPAQGTEATVAGGTSITAGNAITVNAQQWANVDFLVGAIGAGAGGIGAGIGVFSTAFNTNANAGGSYTAGGQFKVSSRLDSTVDAIAFAGGAGFVGLGAAVSVLSDHSYNQSGLADSARVKAASSVDVTAISNRSIHLNTDQGAAGAVAAGASFTRLTSDGQVSADVGLGSRIGQDAGLTVGALHVDAEANFDTYAHTLAFSVGAVAISANFAIVEVTPTLRASVGDASLVKTTGEATVDALSTGKADATVLTVTAGAGATGVSLSSATFSPTVQALFGATSVLNAGGLIRVQARNNHNGTAALANKGAWAQSTAPGFGGFTGNGAVPTAEANGAVKASVGSGSLISAGGRVDVLAYNNNEAEAKALALSVGGATVGVSVGNARANGGTAAELLGGVGASTDLTVRSQARNLANADADASGGGLSGTNGASSTARANGNVQTTIGVAAQDASINASGSIVIESRSSNDATANTFGLSLGVGSAVGIMAASAEASPDVRSTVTGNTQLVSGTGVRVGSYHNQAGEDVRATADAAGGGLGGAVSGTIVNAKSLGNAQSLVGDNTAIAGGSGAVIVEGLSSNTANATGTAFAVGAVLGIGGVVANATTGGTTGAVSGADVTGASYSVLAHADQNADGSAKAAAGGLTAGVTGAGGTSSATPTVNAGIGDGAQVSVGGPISVVAETTSDSDGVASGVAVSAGFSMGISVADATLSPTMTNRIGTGASLSANGAGSDLTIATRVNGGTDKSGGATATATAPSGGLAAGSGTGASAQTTYNVLQSSGSGVTLNAGRDLNVELKLGNHVESTANSDTFGLVAAIGGAVSSATVDGSAQSNFTSASGTVGRNLNALGVSSQPVTSTARASGGGLVSGQINSATASFTPTMGIDLGSGITNVGGSATVQMLSATDTTASAIGKALSIAASIGSSSATATMSPTVFARSGNQQLTAGGAILVEARHNHDGTAATGLNTVATALASAGSALVSGTGASASATASANVDATVGAGSKLTSGGTVKVLADAANLASGDTSGLGAGGLIGFGKSVSSAIVGGGTTADLRGGVGGATSINVIAQGKNTAVASANASGAAGLAGLSGGSATARSNSGVAAGMGDNGVASTATTTGAVLVDAISSADADAKAKAFSFGFAGALGFMSATSQVSPAVTAEVRGTTGVSGNGITVRARHNQAGEDSTAVADAAGVSGGVSVSGADADATAAADTKALTGNATSFNAGNSGVLVQANAVNVVTGTGEAFSGALGVSAGIVSASARSGGITEATSGADVLGSSLNVQSTATQIGNATAEGTAGGLLAAGTGAGVTTTVNPDVRAGLGDGAVIDVAGGINVSGTATTDADGTATGVAVSFGPSLGLSKSDVTLAPTMTLRVGTGVNATTHSANTGDINFALSHNGGSDKAGGATSTAFAAGGGIAAGGGADASAAVNYNINATTGSGVTLNAARGVSFSTQTGAHVEADGDARGFGLVGGLGGALSSATVTGTVNQALGAVSGTQGIDFKVETTANHLVDATSQASTIGLLGSGQINSATANFSPTLTANLGGGGTINVGRDLIVTSLSTADTTATAQGAAISGGIGMGGSFATATMSPSINALTGNETANVGRNIGIRASHNHDGAGSTGGDTNALARSSSGGALLSVAGASSAANANAATTARSGAGSVLTAGGSIAIHSDAANIAHTETSGLSISLVVAAGKSVAASNANGTTTAEIGGGSGGSSFVDVRALGHNYADAQANASGGGLAAGVNSGDATAKAAGGVVAGAGNASSASVVNSSGLINILALSEMDANAQARGLSIGLLGAVGVMSANAEVSPNVTNLVQGTTTLSGQGVSVLAQHNQGGQNARAKADSAGIGAGVTVAGANATAKSGANTSATTLVNATLNGNGGVATVQALASNIVSADGSALGGGGLARGAMTATATSNGTTNANSASRINGAGLVIDATASQNATATSSAAAGGLVFASSGAKATSAVTPTVSAGIGAGAVIDVNGGVNVGANASTASTGIADGVQFSGGVGAGGSVADVDINPTMMANIGNNARITTHGAKGDVQMAVRLNNGDAAAGKATARSSASAGSAISVSGSNSTASTVANLTNNTGSGVLFDTSGDVRFDTLSGLTADAVGDSLNLGLVGAGGVAKSSATMGGTTNATTGAISGSVGGDLVINTASNYRATSDSNAAAGGLLGSGGSNTSNATVTPTINVGIGAGGNIAAGRDVVINNVSTGDADARADGISIGGLGSFSGSDATAVVRPDMDTTVGAADVSAGRNFTVLASHNHTGAGASGQDAHAYANASGGSFGFSGVGANSLAQSSADMNTSLGGAGADLSAGTGDFTVTTRSGNMASAEGYGLSIGGLLGKGNARADSIAGGTLTNAQNNTYGNDNQATTIAAGTGIVAGGNVAIDNISDQGAATDTTAPAGGLIGAASNDSSAIVARNLRTSMLGSGITAGGNILLGGATSGGARATSDATSFGLISLGKAVANAQVTPTVATTAGGVLDAGGRVTIRASHDGSQGATAKGEAGGGSGFASINGADTRAGTAATVSAEIRNGASVNADGGTEVLSAVSDKASARADGEAYSFGVAIGSTDARADANSSSRASVGNAQVTGASLTIDAAGGGRGAATALATTGGLLVAGSGAAPVVNVNPNITAELTGGASVDVGGNVAVRAHGNAEGDGVADGSTFAGLGSSATAAADVHVTPSVHADI